MVKKLLLSLFALAFATQAFGQVIGGFNVPKDVQSMPGGGFTQVAPNYTTNGTLNVVLDSTVTPMPVGAGLTNIPIPSTTNRIVVGSDQTEAKFTAKIDNGSGVAGSLLTVTAMTSGTIYTSELVVGTGLPAAGLKISSQASGTTGGVGTYNLTNADGSAMTALLVGSESMISTNPSSYCLSQINGGPSGCPENKFRTISNATVIAPDDPQRNFAQPGSSHGHQFFACATPNAYTTYKAARSHAIDSVAAGTDVNGTCYWFPFIQVTNPYGDGKNFAIKPMSVTIYYTENPGTTGNGNNAKAPIPTGLRYVLGYDMDAVWSGGASQQYAWLQSYLTAANTTIGHTRYTLANPSGVLGYSVSYACVGATPSSTKYIVNPDGSDPFAGTCGTTAGGTGSTGDFYILIDGPNCYDGTNLWSPGGYKHLIPQIYDNDNNVFTCPNNYYKLPTLHLEVHFNQYGWTDRQRWVLSSDLAYRAKYSLTAAQVPSGTTFHTDWLDGWDDVQRRKWEFNCLGVEHHTGHQCDSSYISPTEYLKGGCCGDGGAGGRTPQVVSTIQDRSSESGIGWQLIPPAWSGGMSGMKVHN